MTNPVYPHAVLRSYFTVDATYNGNIKRGKIALGVFAVTGVALTIIGGLALKGLILVGIAACYKIGILVSGLVLSSVSIICLIDDRDSLLPLDNPFHTNPEDFSSESRHLYLHIRTDILQDKPTTILDKIHEDLENGSIEELTITYIDANRNRSAGIDGGGLGRDFITRIFQSLVNPQNSENLLGFSFEEVDGGMLPVASATKLDETKTLNLTAIKHLNVISALMAFCFKNDRYLIGQIFSPSLFAALSSLTADEASSLTSEAPTSEILTKLYAALNPESMLVRGLNANSLSDSQLVDLLYGVYPGGVPEDPFGDGTDSQVIRDNIETLLRDINTLISNEIAPKDPRTQAMFHIIVGMRSRLTSQDWNEIAGQDPATIQNKIQGELTRELFIAHIQNNFPVNSYTYSRREDRARNFLIQWTNENSIDRLSNLVMAITGSSSLGPNNIYMRISSSATPRLPTYATCYRQMTLSSPETYEEFNRLLNLSIDNALAQGFDQG